MLFISHALLSVNDYLATYGGEKVFVCKYITETECLDSLSIHLANRLSRQLSETRPDNLSKTKFRTIPTAFLSRNLSKNGVNPEIVTQKG